MKPNHTDRGASIAITHALSIGITALLITGLLLSTGNFLQQRQEDVAIQELRDVNGDMAAIIHDIDDLNKTGETVTVTLSPDYPQTITGKPYTIALIPDSTDPTEGLLYVNMSSSGLKDTIEISTDTHLEQSFARGENPTVGLCAGPSGSQSITLGGCP